MKYVAIFDRVEGLEAEECDNPSAIPGLFWRASPAKLDYVEHTGKERLSS